MDDTINQRCKGFKGLSLLVSILISVVGLPDPSHNMAQAAFGDVTADPCPAQQATGRSAQVMQSISANAAGLIQLRFEHTEPCNGKVAGQGKDQIPILADKGLGSGRQWDQVVNLGLVTAGGDQPVGAGKFSPPHMSCFAPTSSRKKDKPHKVSKDARGLGRLPDGPQLIVIQNPIPG
jgi:hypothetical protein